MMKRVILIIVIIIVSSLCYARDTDCMGVYIAVEFRIDNKFNKMVGCLRYDCPENIEIVAFFTTGVSNYVSTRPEIYHIVGKTISSKRVHNIKGEGEHYSIVSGTIDFHEFGKPKITLVTDGGIVITNISTEGKEWQKKHIPNIILGL
jgi:hypothetical protein